MNALTPCDVPGLLPRTAISAVQADEMFALLESHFEGVTRPQFDRDLSAKHWVIQVRHANRLVGFTTLRVTTSHFAGAPVTVI